MRRGESRFDLRLPDDGLEEEEGERESKREERKWEKRGRINE
jgi:hypothetical protein